MVVRLLLVITPSIQISPDVANAQAGLVVDGELELVAQAIAELVKSPNLRRQLGENGKKLVQQQYSWEVIARNLTLYLAPTPYKGGTIRTKPAGSRLKRLFYRVIDKNFCLL